MLELQTTTLKLCTCSNTMSVTVCLLAGPGVGIDPSSVLQPCRCKWVQFQERFGHNSPLSAAQLGLRRCYTVWRVCLCVSGVVSEEPGQRPVHKMDFSPHIFLIN